MKLDLYRLKLRGMKAALIAAGAVVLTFTTPAAWQSAYATTKEEAEQQKEEAEQGKEDADQKAEQYTAEMNELVADVKELDEQSTSLSTQIKTQEQKQSELETEIEDTKKKLAEAQVSENNQYEAMKKRVQYLYEEGDIEYIDALLSSASFQDSLNKSEYVEQISTFDQKQLDKLVQTKQDIVDYEATLESDLAEVEQVKAQLESDKNDLDDVISQKNTKIAEYSSDIEKQEALSAYYQTLKDEADDELAKIAKEEAQKYAQAQAQANSSSSGSSSDSSGGSSDSSGGSDTGTGQLIWPVSSGGVVTDEFGGRESPTAGASSNHQGIDIGCSYGTAIVAADAGTVIIAGYSGGYGNLVAVDHGNGIVTYYGHNSSLAVSVGDTVSQGQTIAYAGSTGVSTGVHCHFGVLVNGSFVNPRNYL